MTKKSGRLLAVFLGLLAATAFVTGCSRQGEVPAPAASPAAPAATQVLADSWLGKWTGPEGTFLQLTGGNGKYELTVQNLDGPRKFQGTATSSGLRFERDGVSEIVRATNGNETGMKWLAGKSNCLTVRVGEGYCKD